jgi:hypothetical protein
MNIIMRKAMSALSPTILIVNEGKHWKFSFKAGPISKELEFNEDEEFDDGNF